VEEIPLARQSVTRSTEILAVQPVELPGLPITTPIIEPPPVIAPSISHKKGGRPPNARKGKLGKNQYTKDRDAPDGEERSPGRSQSRDVARGDDNSHTTSTRGSIHESKLSKAKTGHSKISFSDMKRRVAGILDYIARTQLELAGESISIRSEEAGQLMRNMAESLPMIRVNGDKSEVAMEGGGTVIKDFNDLSCLEMMDVLTRQLVKWQNEYT